MKAMLLQGVEDLSRNHTPLELAELAKPTPEKR